jgi:glycine cleavage system aminomethyltransferase T
VSAPDALRALRHSAALSRLEDVRYLRIAGEGAWEALDRLCASDLYLRDGQMLHGLLLDEEAQPFADSYVGRDDEDCFLLLEGPTGAELEAHLRRHLPGSAPPLRDLSGEVCILEIDGPFAWELLGTVVGPEAIGLPYLTFYHHGDWLIYRAGKTGEYGYGFVVPVAQAAALESRILDAGAAFDLAVADRGALDQCALENWFFNIRREGRARVTPIELQLQWRVSPKKVFVGDDALRRHRTGGVRRRLTCLAGSGPYAPADAVTLEGEAVGAVVNAGASAARDDWVALALIDLEWAHPGLAFAVEHEGVATPARSVSPPVINNRSLRVSPQLHSYASRDTAGPPLARTLP